MPLLKENAEQLGMWLSHEWLYVRRQISEYAEMNGIMTVTKSSPW